MVQSTSKISGQDAYKWGAASLVAAVAIILAALGFEHIGGYEPCTLCLQQRYAYYVGIPILFIALLLIGLEHHRTVMFLFFLVAIAFLANAGLGVYHSGVEWKFWAGPATCDNTTIQSLGGGVSLTKSLAGKSFASCGDATWRFLGLSFAGWNVVICIALTIGCLKAAFASSEESVSV